MTQPWLAATSLEVPSAALTSVRQFQPLFQCSRPPPAPDSLSRSGLAGHGWCFCVFPVGERGWDAEAEVVGRGSRAVCFGTRGHGEVLCLFVLCCLLRSTFTWPFWSWALVHTVSLSWPRATNLAKVPRAGMLRRPWMGFVRRLLPLRGQCGEAVERSGFAGTCFWLLSLFAVPVVVVKVNRTALDCLMTPRRRPRRR
ncbi:hypothetical protein MHYP_G00156900 [Metynnis hypsauchen]